MPIYSHLHGDEDHQHPYPPHHHHHHPHDPHIISPLGIGPRGKDGEKGEKGDPFTFDDFTSEQLADLRDGVSTVYYRKIEAAYTTSGTLTSSIEIPISYTDHDMLFVDIEGLDISEGADYTISGNTIVLTEPITHAGTRVNFTVLSAVAADAEDLEEFWNSIADATVDSRGLMSAADKAKLDGIPENASAVSLQVVTADQPHGRIMAYEPGGAYSIMDVPVLDRSNHVQEANLPTMSETVKGAAKLGRGLEMTDEAVGIASGIQRFYASVEDMQADEDLAAGDLVVAMTSYYGPIAYAIRDTAPAGADAVALDNHLYAVRSPLQTTNVRMYDNDLEIKADPTLVSDMLAISFGRDDQTAVNSSDNSIVIYQIGSNGPTGSAFQLDNGYYAYKLKPGSSPNIFKLESGDDIDDVKRALNQLIDILDSWGFVRTVYFQ